MTDDIDEILDEVDEMTDDDTDDTAEETQGDDEVEEQQDQPTEEIIDRDVPSSASGEAEGEIGHVLSSEGIRVSLQDHNVSVFVTTESREEVRLGDYVQIPYPGQSEYLFTKIDALNYEAYTEIDDKSDVYNKIAKERELKEGEFTLEAELDPISILEEENGEVTRRSVDKIPKPNTPAEISDDEDFLRTGLNIPTEGVFLGYVAVSGEPHPRGRPLTYLLENGQSGEEPAVFRHILTAGSTGKGKSHFAKNVLRQYLNGDTFEIEDENGETVDRELGIVVIDPENEYWEMEEDNPELKNKEEYVNKLRGQGIEIGGVDDLEVFVPMARGTHNPAETTNKEFSVPFSIVEGRSGLIMPYEPTDVTRGAIQDCLSAYFDRFDGEEDTEEEEPTYDGFITFLNNNADEDSPLRQTHNIGDGTWNAMMRRVKSSAFESVFDHTMTSMTDITGEIFRPGRVSVIPTSHLRGSKERLVVLSILSMIVENKIDDYNPDPAIKNTPLLVALDEAHNYLSDVDTLQESYIVSKFREAAKQGRKDKLGLFMITQNPQDIDDQILKQTNTRILLGLSEEVVSSIDVPRGFSNKLPLFGKGQAMVKAPDVQPVEIKGVEYCLTKHKS